MTTQLNSAGPLNLGKARHETARGVSLFASLAAALAFSACAAYGEADAQEVHFAEGPLEAATLPERPAGAHWIWVTDLPHGEYNRALLFDADTGRRLGTIDLGFEGPNLLIPRSGNELYVAGMYYSRAMHGERTDVIEVYDSRTLNLLREIEIPPKRITGWPEPNLAAVSDDDAFVLTQFFTPASSVGITNVRAGEFGSEVQTSGCAFIYPAGANRFFTLCGDGSILAINYDDSGREVSRRRYPRFFDADNDPIHGSGFRSGNIWYFASHRGMIRAVDVSGSRLRFLAPWRVAQREGELTWVPGAFRQSVAIHRDMGRLYLAMHATNFAPKTSGADFQAEPGTEVWVYDMRTRRLINRIRTESTISYLAVSQDEDPLIYTSDIWSRKVITYDEETGQKAGEINLQLTFAMTLQPVE